jgi:PAS domain-containing protein
MREPGWLLGIGILKVLDDVRCLPLLESALTEIRKSEVRLRTIIDTIPVMAWCALPDGFAEFHNQRWLDYTGLSDEEGWGWVGQLRFIQRIRKTP